MVVEDIHLDERTTDTRKEEERSKTLLPIPPHPDYNFSADKLLNVAELAYNSGIADVESWVIEKIADMVNSSTSPLPTASASQLARVLRLVLAYDAPELIHAVEMTWLNRIHRNELSLPHAITFAECHDLPHFLSHLLYIYLARCNPALQHEGHLLRAKSILSTRLTSHLLNGYYSLSAFWRSLQSPPDFSKGEGCAPHGQCIIVWKSRWAAAITQPFPSPEIDLLARLRLVCAYIDRDVILNACMTDSCGRAAIATVSQIRKHLSCNLYHHFDL